MSTNKSTQKTGYRKEAEIHYMLKLCSNDSQNERNVKYLLP